MKNDFEEEIDNKEVKSKNSHEGHRKRMQEKIVKYGLRSLEPHELLEYLLWFTIPRKDTNPIGHDLMDKYGSVANIFNSDIKSLQKVKGVGERTALFLTSLPELFSIYKESYNDGKLDILNNVADCIRFFRSRFEIRKNEEFFIVCLNGMNKVVKYTKVEGINDTTIKIEPSLFGDFINDKNVMNVVVFHTHPFGESNPSYEDIKTTENLISICMCMGKVLIDHIIFSNNNHFSFGRSRLLEQINCKIALKTNPELKEKQEQMIKNRMKSKKFSPFSYLDNSGEDELLVDIEY